MNALANRIYEKIKLLKKEQEGLEQNLKELEREEQHTKSHEHRIELEIAINGTRDKTNSTELMHDLSELRHDRKDIKKDEQLINESKARIKDILKQIDEYTFWMRYADSDNPAKQAEAERRVFP